MRYLVIVLFFVFACQQKQNNLNNTAQSEIKEIEAYSYDSIKAKAYGADEYGMRKYVMAFLKKGPNRDLPKEEASRLQSAHMANIQKMAEMGKLSLAGPFFGDGDLRGIYIFNVESIEEAETLTNSDPAIKAGSLKMELLEWYGSAALMDVNKLHATVALKDM